LEEAVTKEGLRGKEELGIVRELEACSWANGDAEYDIEEYTLTVGGAEWSVAEEDGPVRVADIDE
jgi:hypothetical protein